MQRNELMVNVQRGVLCKQQCQQLFILAKHTYGCIMAKSLPQCPKPGSNTLLRCADVHMEENTQRKLQNHNATRDSHVSCAFPYLQDFSLLFYTTHCASLHEAQQKDSLAVTSDVLQKFKKWQGCLGSG